jgi:toxin ParE1/3/4
MTNYRLSKLADADLAGIADYTVRTFGIKQARIYRDRLLRAFETLAHVPGIDSDCSHLSKGARRFVHHSHVIYFRKARGGMYMLRVLDAEQDPIRHF